MILRRPLLTCLCPLLILTAGATTGRAASEPPAANPIALPAPPPEPVGATAPAPVVVDESAFRAAPAGMVDQPVATPVVAAADAPSHAPANATDDGHKEIVGLLALGASLTERGDWDAAEIAFRQILKSNRAIRDDLPNALLGLARVYRRQGSYTKAAAIYERFLADYPTSDQVPDALLELGRTHRALGAHQLAFARFYNVINSTLKLSSEGFAHYQTLAKTAQFEIAETHFQLGDFAEANKYFSRLSLLDLAPADRARAQFKSAYSLYLGNEYDGAVKALRTFLDQCPQDENVPEARYLLSLSLRTLGRKQEALDTTLQLLRTEQGNTDPKRWSYWQRRTGNQLANDFFQNGDTLNALAIYQGLAALSPEPAWNLPVTYQIGLCYERMRLYDRASSAYQTIVDGAKASPAAGPGIGPAVAAKPGVNEPAKAAATELTELARMATWRLGQLAWQQQTEKQLSGIFTPGAEPGRPTPPDSHAVAPNIDTTATTAPSSAPDHDHPGNPAKTPPSL